ncbi:MAG: acetate/propionate family kinase [Candidatus Microsaccharimonas sp.]
MNILVINAGSSSIKTVLYTLREGSPERILTCNAVNIGQGRASIDVVEDETSSTPAVLPDHTTALSTILTTIGRSVAMEDISVIAHRVVYGGEKYYLPTDITDEVVQDLQSFSSIDPQHAPLSLSIITSLQQQFPNARHVACFDTAFFHDIPEVAQIVPIPHTYRKKGIRRYGYHGLSYQYLSESFGELAGEEARRGRVIYAHLGSGSSMMATVNGQPIDMTMGLTPSSGLVMGSRSGDIDPSLAWILAKQSNVSIDDYQRIINQESGLLAVSEFSTDMYALLQNQTSNPKAALAVELFCYQARKAIGSLATTIGGLDSLIFSGGMGEQSAEIRRRICENLEFLGITIDSDANKRHDLLISSGGSRVGVHVLPTDESLAIARNIVTTTNIDKG